MDLIQSVVEKYRSCETCCCTSITLGTIVVLYFLRKYIQGGQYRKSTRIDGKVVIITGCNTGIGKETALDLAKRGGKIYMACRDLKRAEEARDFIIEKTGSKTVYVRLLDLSSLESIRNFAAKFLKDEKRLDILINNAGVFILERTLTKDGFETQIGVNHMGHFLLTNLLLDLLKKSSPSRIVNVSSMGHLHGKIKKDDLNSVKSYGKFDGYTQSKLANVLFTRELAKRLKGTGVTSYSLHPGAVITDISRNLKFFFITDKFLKPLFWFIAKSAKSGAQTTIYTAIDPDLKNSSGLYYKDCHEATPSKDAQDDNLAKWLWETSEKWVGLSDKKKK